MKRFLAVLLLASCLLLPSCARSPQPPSPKQSVPNQTKSLKLFTLSELKKYDGRQGRKAYVAVNGYIYDVTDEPLWRNGFHEGHRAGTDLTNLMNRSPHGTVILEDYPVVGKLKESPAQTE
ncbi:MAG: cytochrome b5 domain-containing protein [Solirubrobacterales bacterium]